MKATEVYNYAELRAKLTGYGHRFLSGTDTEVILAAYQQWGPDCMDRFNGMWALAVWDHVERKLFLKRFRDNQRPTPRNLTIGTPTPSSTSHPCKSFLSCAPNGGRIS